MPTKHCSWGKCNSDSRYRHKDYMQGVIFFTIPDLLADPNKHKRWIHLCGRADLTTKSTHDPSKARWQRFICSKHFVGGNGPTEQNPDPLPANYTKEQVDSMMNRSFPLDDDRIIPGMMTLDTLSSHVRLHSTDHFDRRPPQHSHHLHNQSYQLSAAVSRPTFVPRQHSSTTVTSVERPPSQLGVAWTAESTSKVQQSRAPSPPALRHPMVEGSEWRTGSGQASFPKGSAPSPLALPPSRLNLPMMGAGERTVSVVEDRLRQHVDSQRPARPLQYDDGDLLLPPQPSRGCGDGVTLGGVTLDQSSTDGTRSFDQRGDEGYVPSASSDRRPGPRGERLLASGYEAAAESQPSSTPSGSKKSPTDSVQDYNERHGAWGTLSQRYTQDLSTPRHTSYGQQIVLVPRGQTGQSYEVATQQRNSQSLSLIPGDYRSLGQAVAHSARPPREGPMGESSSTQGHTVGSSYRVVHTYDHNAGVSTFKSPTGPPTGTGGARRVERPRVGGMDEVDEELSRELRMAAGMYSIAEAGSGDIRGNSRLPSPINTPQTHPKVALSGRSSAGLNRSREIMSSPHLNSSLAAGASNRVVTRPGETRRPVGGATVNAAFEPDDDDDAIKQGAGGRGSQMQHQSQHNLLAADRALDNALSSNTRRQLFHESPARSETPPLPPLSPSSSQPGSAPTTPPGGGGEGQYVVETGQRIGDSAPAHSARRTDSSHPLSAQGYASQPKGVQRSDKAHGVALPAGTKTPDLLASSSSGGSRGDVGPRGPAHHESSSSLRVGQVKTAGPAERFSTNVAGWTQTSVVSRSRSLDDVRESEADSNLCGDNDLSFDVENTLLTLAPSDVSEAGGDVRGVGLQPHHRLHHPPLALADLPHKEARAIRQHLGRLETMYHDVIKHVGGERHAVKGGATRRWSIASSDTSSLRKASRQERGTQGGSAQASRDFRSIQRRFQRLESHVVTLARSLAHLSSELRAHNTLRRDLEALRREMRDLKQQGAALDTPGHLVPSFDKFRGWIPSLTNPKRINKLTQFFGQEPPLLEIFLRKLGYERYVKNFAAEHIGMIELPYLTEERLESIGIPMGPRLRILQESQLCFRQENFNIYIV